MGITGVIVGWFLIGVATVRASLAWGAKVAWAFLIVLGAIRLFVPYGNWFTDPAALFVALNAEPPGEG